jgi:hypothetical protein
MAKKTAKFAHNPGMLLVISYVTLLLVNVLVLWLAASWFPQFIVLGTISLTTTWALWLSMGKLALIGTLLMPFFTEWELRRGKTLTAAEWSIGYFFVNFIGLWTITRFAEVFGLGITSWLVAAVLALVIDFGQGLVMMKMEKWRTA